MRKTNQRASVQLGAASSLTKGPWGHVADDVLKQDMQGLARD